MLRVEEKYCFGSILLKVDIPTQTHNSSRDRLSGDAGIGLAITEQTVSLHSGDVKAFNVKDGGLEVVIRLPITSVL